MTAKHTPQRDQLAPFFPELLLHNTAIAAARQAFYEELLAEGPEEIALAADFWTIDAPPHLVGEARDQYLAGKVAEIEFPSVAPAVADAA
jgi:hypothetical protein